MPTPDSPVVLVVDDDHDVAEMVQMALGEEGVAVVILDRPQPEALGVAIDRLEPACVLLDSESPRAADVTSWEVARWLRGRTPPVPVVMFSANPRAMQEATENASARSRAAGFAAVLAKPFDIGELTRVVQAALAAPVAPSPTAPAQPAARPVPAARRARSGRAAGRGLSP